MGFRMVMGTISQILLLFIILPLLALLLGWLPGGADMLDKIFLEFVSASDIFEGWLQLLNQYATADGAMIPAEQALATIVNLLCHEFLEAMLIGFCVNIALRLCTDSINGSPILPAFCGVLAGVLLLKVFEAGGSAAVEAIVLPLGTIAVMLIGIGLMLGLPHRSSAALKAGAVGMLLNVLVGALVSVCICGMATALTQVSAAVRAGLNSWMILGWYFALLLIMLLLLAVAWFVQKLDG